MGDDRGTGPGLRIGEVARRTGVTTATLRAWEARYGLVPPARTAGGQRLYWEADVGRVQAVRRLVDRGWSVAAAVSQVLGEPGRPGESGGELPGDASAQGRDAAMTSGVLLPGGARRPVLDALAGIDLAFGEGPPLLPRAPSPSVARMRLEAVLPLVMEDARIVVHRLQLSAPGTPSQAGAKIV
jgi:DNA-binding transcriptional MerR regulator